MAVTITGIGENDLHVFADIPLNENMYTMGQVETRLIGVTENVAGMISSAVSTVWKAGGSVDPSGTCGLIEEVSGTGLTAPLLTAENEGKVYHLNADLDITDDMSNFFREGVGTHIEAGTNVAVVHSGYVSGTDTKTFVYDVLAVTDSSVVHSIRIGTSSGEELIPSSGSVVMPYASGSVGGGSGVDGLMAYSDKEKLDSVVSGAEPNVSGFGSISVIGTSGSSTETGSVTASSDSASFTLKAGNNVSLSASGSTITIDATHPSDYVVGNSLHSALISSGFSMSGLPQSPTAGTLYALISALHSVDNQTE